ncbi:MAG TPA: ABC transporter ATP-binding protein, partial [Solirubrobacteraceae bacterium]|nr:ABC transporter ATP-binding protein [Solirubrobacteraceae bacterium]
LVREGGVNVGAVFGGDPGAGSFDEPGRRRSPQQAGYRQRDRKAKLEIKGLHAFYGASHVLFGVDLEVGAGETVALVGRNGAGKTTTLQCAMGMGPIKKTGSVKVDGVETIGMGAHRVARLGVGLVPEGRRVFKDLTVEENLQVAAGSAARAGSGGGGGARESGWPLERVYEVFPLLAGVKRSKGAWLSGGEQQVLAIARALVRGPQLLLLDEPSEGLAPRVVQTLAEQLASIQRTGLAMLLAEQHLGLVGELASRAYALDRGTIRDEGPTAQLLGDPRSSA